MPSLSTSTVVLTFAIVLLFARPAHAFGAGNIASIAKIEGTNWRHGDIEDTLLTLLMSRAAGGKKFDKLSIARVYFGNWLRDYSQAIDVGTVKYVSAEAIRILLWVLGFMTFGYGTKEFEVTAARLGCYRPEDHIDNPKDYADNLDATQYDRRLRGPVNERVELAIDVRTGMKNYIANEQAGIMTSALHVRKLFGESIRLGRSYARSGNKDELYEALRLLGTGLHCLEDFSAHSNYIELALIEMGERDVFPHVGRRTKVRLQGARDEVFPLITGTFGGVDFLHSVMGEFDDKATQSEIEQLEGTMQQGSKGDTSILQGLLSNIPSGIFGGKDEAGKAEELKSNATAAQMSQMRVSPRQPEQFTRQMQEVAKQILPIIEWHDEILKSITETIEQIPILPDMISQLEEQVNIFVFSLIAPFVLPIIQQVKAELNAGSAEIIASSEDKQHIVFNDDSSSDPTHSMLSKDHFSNILNEPAGKIASQVLKWVVPQLIQCWDDESQDVNRVINRIINGVFHHPAQRQQGEDGAQDGRRLLFAVVENWWREQNQNELRRQLSREGIKNGENHKPGVEDHGHGCGKPLGMHQSSGPPGNNNAVANMMMGGLHQGLNDAFGGNANSGTTSSQASKYASVAVGGGALGGIVGAIGGSLLSGVLGGDDSKTQAYSSSGYTQGGGYQQSYTEVGHQGNQYAQAEVTRTTYPEGRQETSYQQYEQPGNAYGGSGRRRNENEGESYGQSTESWRQHTKTEEDDNDEGEARRHHGRRGGQEEEESSGYGSRRGGGENAGYYGGGGGRVEQQQYGGGRNEEHGNGRREQEEYGGGRREQEEFTGGGGRSGYGGGREEQQQYGGGRNEEHGSGRREQEEYGGGRREQEGFTGGGGRSGYGAAVEGLFGGGGNKEEQEEGYGGGRHRGGDEEEESYGGGRRNRGEEEEEEGEEESYGGGRRNRGEDEEEPEERREEGGGGWFS